MRFIHKWSYACANYLVKQLNENHQKRGVYYYGFQMIIGAAVKGTLLVSAGLFLGTLIPTLTALIVFACLRVMAGGYHMDTYGKCIATSLALFIIAGVVVQYTFPLWPLWCIAALIIISFVTGLYVIFKWAPKDTPNRPITKPEEIRKFRAQSKVFMFVWVLVMVLLLFMKLPIYVIAACFGLLLEVFTITPAGYRFFDWISGKIGDTAHCRVQSKVKG